jgi:hypothetical protein
VKQVYAVVNGATVRCGLPTFTGSVKTTVPSPEGDNFYWRVPATASVSPLSDDGFGLLVQCADLTMHPLVVVDGRVFEVDLLDFLKSLVPSLEEATPIT